MLASIIIALTPESVKRRRFLKRERERKQSALEKEVLEDLHFLKECPEYCQVSQERKT